MTKKGAKGENFQVGVMRDSINRADLPNLKFIECQIVGMTNVECGATGKPWEGSCAHPAGASTLYQINLLLKA